MPAQYHMYPAEIKLLTFDFSPATGGTFNDPLVASPAPVITISPTGELATTGSITPFTNTVTVKVTAAAAVVGSDYVVECLATTTAGQKLQDNMKITIRAATDL